MWLDLWKYALHDYKYVFISREHLELLVCNSPQICIVYSWYFSGSLMNIVCWILQASQYHEHSYRGRRWVVVGSTDWQGVLTQKILYAQISSIQAVLSFTYHKMYMSSLTSQSCDDSLLAICLSRQDGTIYIINNPSTHGHQIGWTERGLNCLTFGYSTPMNC